MPTYKNDSDKVINLGGKNLSPGDTLETIRQFDDNDFVNIGDDIRQFGDLIGYAITITSEEPYYSLANDYHDVSFGAAETKTVNVSLSSKVLRVTTDVNLTIKANTSSNPYPYPLDADNHIDVYNHNTITSLVLTSEGSGNARIIELNRRLT